MDIVYFNELGDYLSQRKKGKIKSTDWQDPQCDVEHCVFTRSIYTICH